MATLPYLIPTARYKRAVKVGNKVTFRTEDAVVDPGRITDMYWSSDAAGYNRVVSTDTLVDFYLQIRTKDIYTSVTVSLDTEIEQSEVITGPVDNIVSVPIATDPITGIGAGVVKYNIDEDEEMSFRNSRWISYPRTDRTHSTIYKNDSGKTIMLSIWAKNNARQVEVSVDQNNWINVGTLGHDDDGENVSLLIPPEHYYRINGSTTIMSWAELR